MYVVYALIDPRDNEVRYIGITQDVYQRFIQHISCDGSNFRKDEWIAELKGANKLIIMTTLEVVSNAVEAHSREAYWIYHYLHLGAKLLNNHVPTPLHLQTKRAQALTLKGMRDAETAAIIAATSKAEAVKELHSQGYGKVAVIEKIWKCKHGGSKAYKQGCIEYEEILDNMEVVV